MAKVTISFETENAAFEDNPKEVQDVIAKLAYWVQDGYNWGTARPMATSHTGNINDSNGNKIGEWLIKF